MMKKMLILSCLIAGMLVSCSSDDGISVKFQLKDENGNEKYVFKNNENIIFSLDIINNGEEDAILPAPTYMFGSEIFHVYSSKGEDFGCPYDELTIPDVGHIIIEAKGSVSFICPWMNNPNSKIPYIPNFLGYRIDNIKPLPKGDYYSVFTIKSDEHRIVTYKKTFKIE